jgi:hypothetical protein
VGGDIMLQALSFRALAASGERQIDMVTKPGL